MNKIIKKILLIIFTLTIFMMKVNASNSIPRINITLNGVTLDEINNNDKEIKYPNNKFELLDSSNSSNNLIDDNIEIKGRGNFTWNLDKKPYQIKFSSKKNLLGMGKAKKWVLLANHADASLIRNKIAFDFANFISIPYISNSSFVDLYIDNNYQGNYLLCEKVEVGSNRVNLTNEEGILVELDNNYSYKEDNYFVSNYSKSYFTLKDSVADDIGKENSTTLKSFDKFKKYINKFENYMYSDNNDWNNISEMIDVESFAKYYFIQELSEDPDGLRSSFYMYKDGENDKLHLGPVWDYDIAFGNYKEEKLGGNPNTDYVINAKKYISISNNWYKKLFEYEEFRDILKSMYNTEIKNQLSNILNNIDDYKLLLATSAQENFNKWNVLGNNSFLGQDGHRYLSTYNEEVDYLKKWVEDRINYLNKRYDSESEILKVNYYSHVQDIGWENNFSYDGELSGTQGMSKRLEAIKINLDTFNDNLKDIKITYQTHIQNIGWQNWKSNGEITGTIGKGLRLEAIKIKLENSNDYSIEYRTHVQNIGWQEWKHDGEISGTEGMGLRLEAIEIRLVPKKYNQILYQTHVQNIGWQGWKRDVQMAGTSGLSYRLEGIKIQLFDSEYSGGVEYQTHVQNIGWQDWKHDGKMAGTSGLSYRLEGIRIRLTGEMANHYNIYYRTHVQNMGWQGWVKNGEMSGTSGKSLRLEAIKIKLVPKEE